MAVGFLMGTEWAGVTPIALAADASARRYFRLGRDDGHTAVLMDAPPTDGQTVAPFISIAELLREYGLSAPKIYAQDLEHGFVLLEDLGDAVFSTEIASDRALELPLYAAAVDVLGELHKQPLAKDVPVFTADVMGDMIAPAYDWYRWAITGERADDRRRHAELAITETLTGFAKKSLSLRDYHVENMIWLPDRTDVARVGLLDFQDAMIGPAGYDLASLLMDARRDVPGEIVSEMITRFAAATGLDRADVALSVSALSVQRNLRILGVFARLALKFGKPRYLDFLPRVWRYVQVGLTHPDLEQIAGQIASDMPEPTPQVIRDLANRCGTHK